MAHRLPTPKGPEFPHLILFLASVLVVIAMGSCLQSTFGHSNNEKNYIILEPIPPEYRI
jgi:hypothetical protein